MISNFSDAMVVVQEQAGTIGKLREHNIKLRAEVEALKRKYAELCEVVKVWEKRWSQTRYSISTCKEVEKLWPLPSIDPAQPADGGDDA